MRFAPIAAAAVLLLAVACSEATHPGTGVPYSADDLGWLKRVTRWGEQYTQQSQKIQPAYRDVFSGRRKAGVLRDALRPLRECTQTLQNDVGAPRSDHLREAYQLLLDSCDEDRKDALALVAAAASATGENETAAFRANERSNRLAHRAFRLIEDGLRANRRLGIRGGVVSVSRIEPRLGRAAGKLAVQRVEVRCWSTSDWRPMVREWSAYTGVVGDVAGFVNGSMRVNIAPDECARLAKFVYKRWRPVSPTGLEDAADAVEVLAHESEHLLSPSYSEAEVECQAVQDVSRLAQLLGASQAYSARLAVIYWKRLYKLRPSEYQTTECRRDGLYDEHPETSAFP